MATTITLTMSALIDETLDYAHQYSERPEVVILGADDLASTSDASLTLSTGTASVSDVIELGQELVLVTAKSTDATPAYTVSRGYLGTTKSTYVAGTVGGLNPLYPRHQVKRAIERCYKTLNGYLPNVTSATYNRVAGKQYVTLEATTVRVLEVGYVDTSTFRYTMFGGWTLVEDLPIASYATGKILRVPSFIADDTDLIIKRQVPYAWSADPTTEASTITSPLGSEDLPVLFATARLVTGREISRSELDKVEEWNHEAAIRGGVNLRLVQQLWAEYYRKVDEVKSTMNVPIHRPFRKMPRLPSRVPVRFV